MEGDQSNDVQHRAARLEPAPRAFNRFVDAVLALFDDSEPANVERYLEASRALEESRRTRNSRPQSGQPAG